MGDRSETGGGVSKDDEMRSSASEYDEDHGDDELYTSNNHGPTLDIERLRRRMTERHRIDRAAGVLPKQYGVASKVLDPDEMHDDRGVGDHIMQIRAMLRDLHTDRPKAATVVTSVSLIEAMLKDLHADRTKSASMAKTVSSIEARQKQNHQSLIDAFSGLRQDVANAFGSTQAAVRTACEGVVDQIQEQLSKSNTSVPNAVRTTVDAVMGRVQTVLVENSEGAVRGAVREALRSTAADVAGKVQQQLAQTDTCVKDAVRLSGEAVIDQVQRQLAIMYGQLKEEIRTAGTNTISETQRQILALESRQSAQRVSQLEALHQAQQRSLLEAVHAMQLKVDVTTAPSAAQVQEMLEELVSRLEQGHVQRLRGLADSILCSFWDELVDKVCVAATEGNSHVQPKTVGEDGAEKVVEAIKPWIEKLLTNLRLNLEAGGDSSVDRIGDDIFQQTRTLNRLLHKVDYLVEKIVNGEAGAGLPVPLTELDAAKSPEVLRRSPEVPPEHAVGGLAALLAELNARSPEVSTNDRTDSEGDVQIDDADGQMNEANASKDDPQPSADASIKASRSRFRVPSESSSARTASVASVHVPRRPGDRQQGWTAQREATARGIPAQNSSPSQGGRTQVRTNGGLLAANQYMLDQEARIHEIIRVGRGEVVGAGPSTVQDRAIQVFDAIQACLSGE